MADRDDWYIASLIVVCSSLIGILTIPNQDISFGLRVDFDIVASSAYLVTSILYFGWFRKHGKHTRRLARHYKQLRDEAFLKLKDNSIRWTNSYSALGINDEKVTYPVALFLTEPYQGIESHALQSMFDHLRAKKYKWDVEPFFKCLKGIDEHNRQTVRIMGEIQVAAKVCVMKFPMLEERKAGSTSFYVQERIEYAIGAQTRIYLRNKEIFIDVQKNVSEMIARVEDELVCNLFYGEISAAIFQFAKQIEELEASRASAFGDFSIFKDRLLQRIINSITNQNTLEGTCYVEKRAKLYANSDDPLIRNLVSNS